MPVSYRLAQNAPRFAASIIFANPYVRAGAAIAGWLGLAGLVWDAVNNKWVTLTDGEVSSGYLYAHGFNTQVKYASPDAACNGSAAYLYQANQGKWVYSVVSVSPCRVKMDNGPYNNGYIYDVSIINMGGCPVGWFVTPAGCTQTPPMKDVNKQEFEESLESKPMPERVPLELPPGSPLPIEPDPKINPAPGENPQHRPLFVPTGDPVPNPNYDPNAAPSPSNQPYIQPGTKLNPSPTVNDPFRLDVKPVDRPTTSPNPLPGPVPDPAPNPDDKPKPEETPGLCDLYPDILACVKLDEPKDSDLQTKEIEFNVSPDSGWGSENAACPAPKQIIVQGRTIPIPYDLFCTWASGLRPVILALAWLSAAFIILGAREET